MTGIFLIAHAPLASALRQCVLHVFPESADHVLALDVMPNVSPDESLAQAQILMAQNPMPQTLILTDLFGATPCNVAQRLVTSPRVKLMAGVNLPMLLRSVTYRDEPLEALIARAMVGATQGVMQVAVTAQQNQAKRNSDDQEHRHHQQ
ncbi:MAG: PTS fructose transporter subunit IIA [Hydrogenophaga sp.]